MIKTFRFFGLSLLTLISIVLLSRNTNYAFQVEHAHPAQVSTNLNTLLGISVIRQVEPGYPALARAARVDGTVIVEVAVDGNGKVTSAKALSGHPLLKDPSVSAACGWEFTPIAIGNESEKVIGTITFDYSISGWREELAKAQVKAEREPDSPEALAELARAYANNYRNDEALKNYEKVIRLKPDYDEDIYWRLASLDYPRRIEIYEEGLRAFPHSVVLMKYLAREFHETGKYYEAVEQYQKALLVEPNNLGFLLEIANFYQDMLRFEESVTFLQKIITIEPDNYLAHEKAGFTYLQSGDLDKAEQYLKKALSISEFSSGWAYLGDVYQQKGDYAAAAQAREKAAQVVDQRFQLKRINANLNLEPITTKLKP